jgi:hypothetical protein
MSESCAETTHTKTALDLREAAARCGFTTTVFKRWLKYKLLPADPNNGFWYGEQLDAEFDRLERYGHLPTLAANRKHQHTPLPNVHPPHRKVNHGGYNGYKRYYYFRPTGEPLVGSPGSPEFMQALIRATREWSKQETEREPSKQASNTDSSARTEQQRNPQPVSTDAFLQMGAASPSDHQLPLYPTEWELGVAVLGLQRAHEWPAIAQALEREGLPLADPLTGARFRPGVEAFFMARHGLDGGLATKKGASGPQQRARLALRNPQAAAPIDVSNAASQGPVHLTPEELCERWRQRVAIETLSNWRSAGVGPPATRIGRAILYRVDLLEEWERQQLSPKPKP